MTSPLLSVRELRVAFGRTAAVEDVSFDLTAGEILAIVGESGSGKSVTALAITRLVEFGGGRIVGGGIGWRGAAATDLAAASEAELQRIRGGEIGMIFQEPMTSLNPVQTVGAQIAESFRLHAALGRRAAREAACEALARVRIADPRRRLHAYPHELSGGMRQRVMIAIAIACRPRLLIADEPTTALDVSVQAQIVELLRELQRETGMAMIFITHDIALAAGLAWRIVVMRAGRVVEQGPTGQVLADPQHEYTRALIRSVPNFSGGAAVRRDGLLAPAEALLRVRGLGVSFAGARLWPWHRGEVRAVEDVGFTLRRGETLALVGESGSGKSSVARAILGLVRPDRGDVTLPGHPGARGVVQMVFQDPYSSMNPRMTVESVLAEPAIAAGTRSREALRRRMRALLRGVGMPEDILDRYPHAFSGGQRQRICIARALMTDPEVIVLDEALSALDVSLRAQVLDLLLSLQRERGLAYLFISHDVAVVERIAHSVAVMQAGRIVEFGDAASVLSEPRHAYTRQLIAAVPRLPPGLEDGLSGHASE